MTEIPPQIQKCHDVWANTLGGHRRIAALEIEKLLEVVKVEFPPYRWAAWVRWKLYRLTQRRRKE